jgi:hypothetical protein
MPISSSGVLRSARQSLSSVGTLGSILPRSIRPYTSVATPMRSATSAWVIPARIRASREASPTVAASFFSIRRTAGGSAEALRRTERRPEDNETVEPFRLDLTTRTLSMLLAGRESPSGACPQRGLYNLPRREHLPLFATSHPIWQVGFHRLYAS